MSIIHGSWIIRDQESYFFVWGEIWRTINDKNLTENKINPHPFAMNFEELQGFLEQRKLKLDIKPGQWQTEIINIPTLFKVRSKTIIPIFSNKNLEVTKYIRLANWEVQGLKISPKEAIDFLHRLPLNAVENQDNYLGGDLRFWTHIYRWSLDLLVRKKYLPALYYLGGNQAQSSWQPLLDSTIDQTRLARFMRLIPDSCSAYLINDKSLNTQQLLLQGLSIILDTKVRTFLNINNIPLKKNSLQPWLNSLTKAQTSYQDESKNINRLATALLNWSLPLQDYLVNENNTNLGQNQYRVCLSLIPPKNSDLDWKLHYYLQALDDPSLIIDSVTIWENPVEQLVIADRLVDQPQETFLKGLGLACKLYQPIAESLSQPQPIECQLNPIEVYQFIRAIAWQLQDNGLGVILPPGLANGAGEQRLGVKITAEVNQEKGQRLTLKSLLNYKLEIAIADQTISQTEFEELLAKQSPIVEINGQWIALQPTDVKAAQAVFNNTTEILNFSVEDALRFSTGDAKTIAKLPVVNFEASGILADLINNLNNNQALELLATPDTFKGELRPYQIKGFSWLSFLENWGLGACLADDMGLGKTIQLIAFILKLKEKNTLQNPILLVCPTSVLGNWEREVHKFAPSITTLIHHGDQRDKTSNFAKIIRKKDLVITSYSLVYRDLKTLEKIHWQIVVLDEAQNIKNSVAKQSQAVRNLSTDFRIALTGTPVENRLTELWSILDFLNPGFLGNKQFFQRRFAIPIEKYGDQESLQTLRSLVQPFILRRLKTDKNIIQDLPEKQEMNVFCGLSLEQANLYQELVEQSLVEIDESEGIVRRGKILTLLLRLKQVCNHPDLISKTKSSQNFSSKSGKLLRLEEMLDEIISEGDRTLIFTQFAEWGNLLQPYLQEKLGVSVLFLSGSTKRQQREEMVDCFQNDPQGPPIFILSLKAGGTGLNLTRANHVFHIDRWWNPAVENQATDRAFRIGQKRNVQVHKFVCTGTLEERINDMIESKKQLAEQTVDAGENWLTELDTDQLRNLLILDRSAIIGE
jgi:SNF2 family DNA or RNA helicase